MPDQIHINALRVTTLIGVPDEERAAPQQVEVTLHITPRRSFHEMNDDISATVDYYQVALGVEKIAMERPRKLIETLAQNIAAYVLENFDVERLEVVIDKYILPNTKSVSVSITRP